MLVRNCLCYGSGEGGRGGDGRTTEIVVGTMLLWNEDSARRRDRQKEERLFENVMTGRTDKEGSNSWALFCLLGFCLFVLFP